MKQNMFGKNGSGDWDTSPVRDKVEICCGAPRTRQPVSWAEALFPFTLKGFSLEFVKDRSWQKL